VRRSDTRAGHLENKLRNDWVEVKAEDGNETGQTGNADR
jgi:hypothetical protein